MELEKYEFAEDKGKHLSYDFCSTGSKGEIMKVVQFVKITSLKKEVYNLILGDMDNHTHVDTLVNTNNGDRDKVLATVADIVLNFLQKRPSASVFFSGNTEGRNRLYRMGIAKVLDEINKSFIIRGFVNGEWEVFKPNREYSSYLLECKY